MDHSEKSAIESRIPAVVGVLVDHLGTLARTDQRLAGLLEQVGKAILQLAATARPSPPDDKEHRPEEVDSETAELITSALIAETATQRSAYRADEIESKPSSADLAGLTFAPPPSAAPAYEQYGTRQAFIASPETLALIESRCRIKAEGCRWQLKRHRLLEQGADFRTEIQPLDAEIIDRARALQDCYLWMCNPNAPIPEALSLFDDVADCFDICGDAAVLLRTVSEGTTDSEGYLERALDLAAEAQSMLRVILIDFGDVTDSDQNYLFQWLRQRCQEAQILIQRHMRLDDPADPSKINELRERIQTLDSEINQRRERDKARRSHYNKIRYHLKQITQKPAQDHDRDWQTIARTVESLIEGGVPPSNVELRDLLLPFGDSMPDVAVESPGMQRVLVEIDRYVASRPTLTEPGTREQPTQSVEAVAELLAGRSILMIGGEVRPHAKKALESAFRLRELVWMKTREHNTRIDFDPEVSRSDVAVVLLAIRWSRHSYSEVETSCDKFGKPLVRLPAGYHPNQVAEQILDQCSERLREA